MTDTDTNRDHRIPLPELAVGGGRRELSRGYFPEAGKAERASVRFAFGLSEVDGTTREFVRLRCAREHDCRVCQSVRYSTTSSEAGFLAEDELDKIDFYERSDLPESIKVALRYTDAYVIAPDTVPQAVFDDLVRHYTDAQIVELTLLIMKWSSQKTLVALGYDDLDPSVASAGGPALPGRIVDPRGGTGTPT
jgi:alkylhydroperoxidase family enzyme